jgi:hypothetical protein
MSKDTKTQRVDANRYRGQWLAVHPTTHQVVAYHASFKVAREAARKRGVYRPVLYAVPKSDGYFVGPIFVGPLPAA